MAEVQAWILIIVQIIMAFGVLFNVQQLWSAKRSVVDASGRVHAAIAAVAGDIEKVEIATNSMKDALVAATATAAGLEGEKRGAAAEVAKQEATKEQM